MIRKLYPYGKKKAFNVTYDDGYAALKRTLSI